MLPEQLGAADHDQDKAEAEHQTGKQSAYSERHHPIGAGQHRGGKHGAERDEGAAEHGERQQAEHVHAGLLHADRFRLLRDLGWQQRIDAVIVVRTAVHPHSVNCQASRG